MKIAQAVERHLQYHRVNSKKNTVKTCEFVLCRFSETFADLELEEVGQEEILDFLIKLTNGNRQSTKRNRYSTLSSFYNFTINTASPELTNHCTTPIIKKIFRRATCIQWKIIDKETTDEIIFRTMNTRNRIIMELMARGGMRIGEVLKLTPNDIENRKLITQEPKSGRAGEVVFIPRKLLLRLNDYVKDRKLNATEMIFQIVYGAAWAMVKKAGEMVGVKLRPHAHASHAGSNR